MKNIEIEARFKDIDIEKIREKIKKLGGEDLGEQLLEETIFYDLDLKWRDEGKFARIRKSSGKSVFTYKHIKSDTIDGAEEIEFVVDNPEKLQDFIQKFNLVPFRTQQKRRHSLLLNGVKFDIDQWPLIPAYLEVEGDSEKVVREASEKVGLNWSDALFIDARKIIEEYGVDVSKFKNFTFAKCE